MIDREPQKPHVVKLNLGEGKEFHLPEQAGSAYLYPKSKYDHIGAVLEYSNVVVENDEGEEVALPARMLFFFRGSVHNFDGAVQEMERHDFRVLKKDELLEVDRQMFKIYKEHQSPVLLELEEDGTDYYMRPAVINLAKLTGQLAARDELGIPYPEDQWGATKAAAADRWGKFAAWWAEGMANGTLGEY